MYHHTPPGYDCPFCRIVQGEDVVGGTVQPDVFYRTDDVTAFICLTWWVNTPGHAIVIPNHHVENIYDLLPEIAAPVHEAARQVAIALKQVYRCDGISLRQHNEPAGCQDVWHYHLHVFPRYTGDQLYERHAEYRLTTPQERLPYAEKLRAYFYGPNPPSPLPRL